MEIEVKQRNSQRNRRRERAQRILAQRESLASAKQQQNLHNHHNHNNQSRQRSGGGGGGVGGNNDDEDSHSGDDDEQLGLSRSSRPRDNHQRPVRPPRPPRPRKKTGLTGNSVKEPPFEEDIIDGFAILAFRTYEDLESAIKLAGKNNLKKLHSLLTIEEKPKVDTGQNNRHNDHHIKNHFKHNHYTHNSILTPSTLNQGLDAGTSDDSGRASEQLHGPGIPRDSQDADSSRDHLSDASSHCSSGKGYICDSEGEDDKGSDAESILFESSTPPLPRKYELPSSSPHVLPPANGAGGSPPDTGGQISNPATDAPAPIPPPVPASAPVPTVPSPPSPTLPPHISQPPMTSPLAANPRAIAPQQRPASPAHPPPSLPQQPHTTIPALHPPNVPLVSSSHNTTSPAVASLGVTPAAPSNGAATTSYPPSLPMAAYPQTQPSYPPLYTPYASLNHSPYLSPAVPSPSHSASSRADVRSSRASPHTNSISKPPLTNNVTNHNSSTPLSAATTTCVSTITNTVTTANTIAHRDIVTCSLAGRINNNNSPRGHSPNRERDSYSSNVSTLSRGSITPVSVPNTSSPANSSLPAYSKAQGWISSSTSSQLSPATGTSVPRPTPPPQSTALGMHNFPPPMFAAPLPPPVSSSSPHTSLPSLQPPTTNPNPFSAESLFQSRVTHVTGQTDMLRRELDNRFLASSQDRNVAVSNLAPPPYLRTEMHHHQHQHTHVHQHTTPLLPPPAATTLFPPPIFKDIPKLGSVDSPFFRGNLNLSSYPGFNTGLLHPGMGPSTPFVPPNHLTSFAPKKTGKWNAMHVRIAWEIYHHKQKTEGKGGGVDSKTELLRPPGHLYPGGPGGSLGLGAQSLAPPFPSNMPQNHPGAPPPPHPVGFLSTSASHLGTGMSPFGRYPASFGGGNPNFPTLSGFPPTREMSQLSGLTSAVHDPWRGLQRANPGFPPTTVSWNLKPEPPQIDRRAELEERERERERQRREREELERQRREREREEHERQRREREELERQRREREREEQRERERREREKEEKRKQQEAAERERERRDKERREMERREMERERMMHQNRQNALMGRERSPLRNGTMDPSEVRVKEEPRSKDDDVVMLSRGPMQSQVPGPGQGGPSPIPDPRYHHPHHAYLAARHQHSLQTSHMSRSMMPTLSHTMQHFPPPPPPPPPSGPGGQPGGPWSSDPFRDPYRYDPLQQLRYNPLMAAAAFRAEEEERAKIYAGYQQSAGLRAKDPSPGPLSNLHMHHRAGPGPGAGQRQVDGMIHGDLHKKEDSSQSR